VNAINEAEYKTLILPRRAVKYFGLKLDGGKITLAGTDISFSGSDIKIHLSSCKACALFAVTLGFGVDNEINRLQVSDIYRAVELYSFADEAIKRELNSIACEVKNYRAETSGKFNAEVCAPVFTTEIFTPGQGDFPIESQRSILSVLNAYKTCGIAVTESFMLTPQKSVTGVIGISDTPVCGKKRGCDNCNLQNCGLRRVLYKGDFAANS
jgi:Fe-S cluster biogenesis protein NfuA